MGSLPKELEAVRKGLGKKSSFEESVQRLTMIVRHETMSSANREEQGEVMQLVNRVAVLLQTRYTTRGFWQAGLKLFEAASTASRAAAAAAADRSMASYSKQVNSHLEKAREFLKEADGPGDSMEQQQEEEEGAAASRRNEQQRVQPFFFEGQLTRGSEPPPAPHFTEQEAVFSALVQAFSTNQAAVWDALNDGVTQQRALQNGDATEGNGSRSSRRERAGGRSEEEEEERHEDVRQEEEEGQDAVDGAGTSGGNGARARGGVGDGTVASLLNEAQRAIEGLMNRTEALDAALLNLGMMADANGGGPRGAPPASKAEVEKLPKLEVTEENVKELGSISDCAVCQEAFEVGNFIQQMPCKHQFHVDCLKPWLDLHNSCPTCRLELPTDDNDYEKEKERKRQEDEDRRGMANAVKEGQYMYM